MNLRNLIKKGLLLLVSVSFATQAHENESEHQALERFFEELSSEDVAVNRDRDHGVKLESSQLDRASLNEQCNALSATVYETPVMSDEDGQEEIQTRVEILRSQISLIKNHIDTMKNLECQEASIKSKRNVRREYQDLLGQSYKTFFFQAYIEQEGVPSTSEDLPFLAHLEAIDSLLLRLDAGREQWKEAQRLVGYSSTQLNDSCMESITQVYRVAENLDDTGEIIWEMAPPRLEEDVYNFFEVSIMTDTFIDITKDVYYISQDACDEVAESFLEAQSALNFISYAHRRVKRSLYSFYERFYNDYFGESGISSSAANAE